MSIILGIRMGRRRGLRETVDLLDSIAMSEHHGGWAKTIRTLDISSNEYISGNFLNLQNICSEFPTSN